MKKMPDLEGLGVFTKVSEMGSFAGAARELNLSNQTVSKVITRLELRLGKKLFVRSTRQLTLTEAGFRLFAGASKIVSQASALEQQFLSRLANEQAANLALGKCN